MWIRDSFPQDPIADYFQSLRPGYASLYWLLAQAGDRSFAGEQVLPSVLSLIAVGYFFGLIMALFHSRAVATLTAILFRKLSG